MRIGRKEALLALVATVIPWIGRRANAQESRLREPATLRGPAQSPEVVELQRRVAALEAQLANQVGFTRDAAGNLQLRGTGSIRLESTGGLTMWAGSALDMRSGGKLDINAGSMLDMRASATASLKGATIALN